MNVLEQLMLPNIPERPFGYILLLIYFLSLLGGGYQLNWRLTGRQLMQTAGLLLLSWFIIPFMRYESQIPILFFEFVPIFLAAYFLPASAALLVGLGVGFAHMVMVTPQIGMPFYFGLIGVVTHFGSRQNYRGRFFQILRQPVILALIATLLLGIFYLFDGYSYISTDSSALAAIELIFVTGWKQVLIWFIETMLGAFVITLIVTMLDIVPSRYGWLLLDSEKKSEIFPFSKTIMQRLIGNFIFFIISILFIVGAAVAALSWFASRELVVSQIIHDVEAVSLRLPEFQLQRVNFLSISVKNEEFTKTLIEGNDEERLQKMRQLFRSSAYYKELLFVDNSGQVLLNYPPSEGRIFLTEEEAVTVQQLARNSNMSGEMSGAQEMGTEFIISVVVPIRNSENGTEGSLIGRIPLSELNPLISGLQGTLGEGKGFLVNENNQIIAHPNRSLLMEHWEPKEDAKLTGLFTDVQDGGVYYEFDEESGARQISYYLPNSESNWTVVANVPSIFILSQSIRIGIPLLAVLLVAVLIFFAQVWTLARDIVNPVRDLLNATLRIREGDLDTPIQIQGEDEVAQLGVSFAKMQEALKMQLNDLSLLLNVSQDISSSMDIHRGLPVIMQSVLRITGASGVRIVVQSPVSRQPLAFSEGPSSRPMGYLDRKLMHLSREKRELVLTSEAEIYEKLDLPSSRKLPISALVSVVLNSHGKQQGILWFGYRQAHHINKRELDLIHTLAGQASVLADNSRLFTTAESGRRRLRAVLSSIIDAVVVTDSTDRVILMNPSMARIFNLNSAEIVERGVPIDHVIPPGELLDALTTGDNDSINIEIPLVGKTYLGNISTIYSTSNQPLGRVAVLHDVSHFKALDQLKSEFVSTVSHDLRSPLTYIHGYATMLPMIGELNDKQGLYADKIVTGIEQITVLVNDLLDLGKLESGAEMMRDEVNIKNLFASIVDLHEIPIAENGTRISYEVDPAVMNIIGDSSLLKQALNNLVGNAVKYASESSEIILRAVPKGSNVVLSVIDDGPGIPKQNVLRLFEKFYRVKSKEKGLLKGSGLGLSIVKTIAEQHGGKVWCESEIGIGTTFHIEIPARGLPEESN